MAAVTIFLAVSFLNFKGANAQVNFPSSEDLSEQDYYKSMMTDDFEKILARYAFVGDFRVKPQERDISSEIFWKYSFRLPKIRFMMPEKLDDLNKVIPVTEGASRGIEHINRGRVLFMQGKYEEARETWLAARRIAASSKFLNRRVHYFIGTVYLKLAHIKFQELGIKNSEVEALYSNAATFLGTAYRPPMNIKDEALDPYTGKVFYALAAIFHNYGRFPQAFNTANEGLNYLRVKGVKIFRHELRRIVAESLILNQTYLDAVQEIDMAIRQDPSPAKAASDFARVGDIYFGLNNYELAEDVYGLSIGIDKDLKLISSHQAILRGESLFWLGRFDESEHMLEYGVKGTLKKNTKTVLADDIVQFASLRIADIYLHRSSVAKGEERKKYLDKAKLKYFKVSQQFSGSEASNIAKLRLACMELPYYKGHNVSHARNFLKSLDDNFSFPVRAQELGMACYVGSYVQRDRSKEMLEKIQKFADKYPESKFLGNLVEPVREYKAGELDRLFDKKQIAAAVKYFEENRAKLFKKGPSVSAAANLFDEYFKRGDVAKAKEFWEDYKKNFEAKKKVASANEILKRLVYLEESLKENPEYSEEITEVTNKLMQEGVDFSTIDNFLLTRLKLADIDNSSLTVQVKIAQITSRKSIQSLCETFVPTVTKFLANEPQKEMLLGIEDEVVSITNQNYVNLSKDGLDCAHGLLNLEFKILQANNHLDKYKNNWLERTGWPMNDHVVAHMWQASELFEKDGDTAKAVKIWTDIKNNGPKNSIEVKLSSSRLEKEKTVLQDLWE